ncbi:MAG TPA: xanthine dehydrogenase family protein molybdopterin-binding subunit [Reyranella sp.]|nr:xanthine dehydrogenase family protein molybdopterin-binding subunit [Reyranella sp.]
MAKFGIGQSVRRVEDPRLLTGGGRYTDDTKLNAPAARAYVLRSPHAHADIRSIDTATARKAPGVLLVLTGEDVTKADFGDVPCLVPLENRDGTPRGDTSRPMLAKGRVRHVGDPVALVVAETLEQAKDAAELIEVDFAARPHTVGTYESAQPGAPLVHDHIKDNIVFDWEMGDRARTETAFAKADRIVRLQIVNNRLVVNSMEPRGAICEYDPKDDRSTLWVSSQGVSMIRPVVADMILKIGSPKLRVRTGDVGGGFGMKIFVHPEYPMVVWASRTLKRTVKWIPDRQEAFQSDVQGRDHVSIAEMALDKDCRFIGCRITTYAALGAYLSHFSAFIPTLAGSSMLVGLYQTPAVYVNVKGVLTNTVPTDAYRGAGRPEAAYALERLIDVAARRLGFASDELRRRNFIQPAAMPHTTPLGLVYDSGDFARNMRDALAAIDAAGFAARRAEARALGCYRGLGQAVYIEQSGFPPDEFAELRFDPAGTLTVLMGSQSSGQGHQTAYSQLAAERLGLALDKIRVLQGDTAMIGFGRGTGGSRSLPVGGAALVHAADKLVAKGKRIAAHLLEAAEADIAFEDAVFTITGTDRSVSIEAVARAAFNPAQLPPGLEPGFAESGHFTPPAPTFPNGCHGCEVEVDPETGHIAILRYVVVDDFGTVINPLLLRGQVHGGFAQGIGQAMLERCIYDEESGQLVTGSLTDYALPRAEDLPALDFRYNVVPCRTNPLGVKGAGEAGAIGAPPALINAVVDAVAELGIDHLDMPLTPERLWRALRDATERKAA